MSSSKDATVPATRRSRKSVGGAAEMKRYTDKENATVDVGSATLGASRQKSRSKSIGPGGLDALKAGTGNRRATLAAPAKPPRSILKPTIYSVQEIPPLITKRRSTRRSTEARESNTATISSAEDSANGSKVALRTEEEQQAAAREREERDRRDARRKSLANRRVSFAAEATLHTFHEIESMQDSTTSTDATQGNSTINGTDMSGTVPKSPDNSRANRRSSGLPQMNFNNADDEDTLTSTIYSSDSEPADAVEEIEDEEDDGTSGSDSDDGTMMTIETEDITGTTIASDRSPGSDDGSSTLEEALRIAAQRAGTQRLEEGDSQDTSDGEEVIPSFGWVKKPSQAPSAQSTGSDDNGTNMDLDMDMEMTNAVGGILRPQNDVTMNQNEDMSMDVTQAFGGILHQDKTLTRQPVFGGDDGNGMTMELTSAFGGIHHAQAEDHWESDANEEMSMEFTAALGTYFAQQKRASIDASRRRTLDRANVAEAEDATMDMDMTVGVGGILSPAGQAYNDADAEDTGGMDMTTAIGGIVPTAESKRQSLRSKGVDEAQKPSTPDTTAASAARKPLSSRATLLPKMPEPTAEFLDSPDLSAFRGKGLRRSQGTSLFNAPKSPSSAKPQTPEAPSTPASVASRTRSKSPRSATLRGKKAIDASSSPLRSPVSAKKPPRSASRLFEDNVKTGQRTPTVVLTPQTRRLSGLGADKSGLGSPQVTALLDGRGSIGQSATHFIPGQRSDTDFEDPQMMAEEVDRERQSEGDKENKHARFSAETSKSQEDSDATFNLRGMIDSLSPKRPLYGRKSLHVGSAKGLLGKRPVELDDDDESENDGIKRLKGHQGSPVKNVKLKHPPSVSETTGRPLRARRALDDSENHTAPINMSPVKMSMTTSSQSDGRFKEPNNAQTIHDVNFHQLHPRAEEEPIEDEQGRIQLQDFLNLTSIRFMELTTTKRRHTVAPGAVQGGNSGEKGDEMSLERCVVSGACTIPMLELYQHSCRELRNYIAEGRRMVREIEVETFEENPPLFQEYLSATPEVKALMDNQFKNVKTHARLLSKAMWYEWRMKLQEGLKEGLVKISDGMDCDDGMLEEREGILAASLPKLVAKFDAAEEDFDNLQEAAQELADCDPAELHAARDELTNMTADTDAKKKLIEELRAQLEEATAEAEDLTAQKQHLQYQIQASENIREACRGWTGSEVDAIKARVDTIEKKHGWAITGLSGTNLSMTYRREVEIVLDIAAFQPHQGNARIDLWYIGDQGKNNKTAEKEFFLQSIRDHVRGLPQSATRIRDLLEVVRNAWDKARFVTSQIRRINLTFPTQVSKTSDTSVAITSSLMLPTLATRVEATLHLHGHSAAKGVDVSVSVQTKVVYGEHFNVSKVGEFLAGKVGDRVEMVEGHDWSDALAELQKRLIARGKKQVA